MIGALPKNNTIERSIGMKQTFARLVNSRLKVQLTAR